jgi:hypothetical protein
MAGSGSASDPLIRGMDPRIRIRIQIRTKISWIRNTGRILESSKLKILSIQGAKYFNKKSILVLLKLNYKLDRLLCGDKVYA